MSDDNPKRKRRFSQKQYDMLKRCSEKGDITEWNEWREKHKWLPVYLEGADLWAARIEGANLLGADEEWAEFGPVHMERADLRGAHLDGGGLTGAHLEGALLVAADLAWAGILDAHLEGAVLVGARLEGATLWNTHLERADLANTHLEGADFSEAIVDGATLFSGCLVDKKTNFTTVGLDSARVEPGLKQCLEYNIRRLGWQRWYKKHRLLAAPVWLFWAASDYGRSTGRILASFFGLSLLFALIYFFVGKACYPEPGLVANLFVSGTSGWFIFLRSVYFSVVTMTTLGFGDLYAQETSAWGHVLLTLQVLLGYALLGALVTRFAVLFTAGGPAGSFTDDKSFMDHMKAIGRGIKRAWNWLISRPSAIINRFRRKPVDTAPDRPTSEDK